MHEATTMDPQIFRALAIRRALILYARTGIKANRAYTPANMMAAATQITGKRFAPRAYDAAADALEAWIIERNSPDANA